MPVRVEWRGDDFLKKLGNAVKDDLRAIGLQAAEDARSLCPVDTGKLRASITLTQEPATGAITLRSDVSYAGYVIYGTRFRAPVPFMQVALAVATEKVAALGAKYGVKIEIKNTNDFVGGKGSARAFYG